MAPSRAAGTAQRATGFQVAQAEVHEQAGQEDVQDRQPLHRLVGKLGGQQEEEQIGRVEQAGLHVGQKGRAAVKVRIPQGQLAGAQAGRRKAVGGEEEGDQVAAAGRLPGVGGEQDAPEKAQRGQPAGGRVAGPGLRIRVTDALWLMASLLRTLVPTPPDRPAGPHRRAGAVPGGCRSAGRRVQGLQQVEARPPNW